MTDSSGGLTTSPDRHPWQEEGETLRCDKSEVAPPDLSPRCHDASHPRPLGPAHQRENEPSSRFVQRVLPEVVPSGSAPSTRQPRGQAMRWLQSAAIDTTARLRWMLHGLHGQFSGRERIDATTTAAKNQIRNSFAMGTSRVFFPCWPARPQQPPEPLMMYRA